MPNTNSVRLRRWGQMSSALNVSRGSKFILFIIISIGIIAISCERYGRYPEDLGYGYKVDFTTGYSSDKAIMDSLNRGIVFRGLLDYKYDSEFITARERPKDSIPECVHGPNRTFDECERAFKKSNFNQYWIIHKTDHKVYGPFKFEAYQARLRELNVPDSLKIEVPIK